MGSLLFSLHQYLRSHISCWWCNLFCYHLLRKERITKKVLGKRIHCNRCTTSGYWRKKHALRSRLSALHHRVLWAYRDLACVSRDECYHNFFLLCDSKGN